MGLIEESIRVKRCQGVSEHLILAIDVHSDGVCQILSEETGIALSSFKDIFVMLRGDIQGAITTLLEREEAYVREQADDPAAFAARDLAFEIAVDTERQIYHFFKSRMNPSSWKGYGFKTTIARTPSKALANIRRIIDLLNNNPMTFSDIMGNEMNTSDFREKLQKVLNPLETTIEKVKLERQELKEALDKRDDAFAHWQLVYKNVASIAEGFFRRAKKDYLAETLKPTKKKTSGRAGKEDLPPLDA